MSANCSECFADLYMDNNGYYCPICKCEAEKEAQQQIIDLQDEIINKLEEYNNFSNLWGVKRRATFNMKELAPLKEELKGLKE